MASELREYWDRAFAAFDRAVALPPGDRALFLEKECGGDEELRKLVLRLIADDELLGAATDGGDGPIRLASDLDDWRPLRAGEVVGPWTVVKRVGAGTTGVVYRGRREGESGDRDVAIKALRPCFGTPAVLGAIERSGRELSGLTHLGIAAVLGGGTHASRAGEAPEFAYLAGEFVDGLPLDRFAAVHALPTTEVMRLIALASDAVQYAHERGVLHRDLKPANVLVDAAAQPRIVDFGVAAIAGTDVGAIAAGADARRMSETLAFLSPEQAAGRVDGIDARTDVYGLGALAYALLAGAAPFETGDAPPDEALRMVRDGSPRPLGALSPACRGDICTIVRTAMAREKDDRYESAALFAADIRRSLDRRPIRAKPPGIARRLSDWVRRMGGSARML